MVQKFPKLLSGADCISLECAYTVKLALRTPHYYGQFAQLPLGKESPYIFCKFNPLYTDTPLILTLSMAPSVSVVTGFDCSLISSIYYKTEVHS